MGIPQHNTHIFFIGGAADQEPYYLFGPFNRINRACSALRRKIRSEPFAARCQTHILGYNKIYLTKDIEKYVLRKIAWDDAVYLVGHSLGAWNAAHLSHRLYEKQRRVKMLITLDPVGKGTLVWAGSLIFHDPEPQPNADFWLNIRTESARFDRSDIVAHIGKQWKIEQGPDINEILNVHHFNAYRLFMSGLSNGNRAVEYLVDSLKRSYAE